MEKSQLWRIVSERLQQSISKPSYDTWIKNLKAVELKNGQLILAANNEFQKGWVEQQYLARIEKWLEEIAGEKISLRLIVEEEEKSEKEFLPTSTASGTVGISELLQRIEELEKRVCELEKSEKSGQKDCHDQSDNE